MEHTINYDSFLILSILAFITPILISKIKKFRIPFVVGEIFVGIIIGKSFLNVVHDDIWIHFLSNFGLAYLMFLSGLELSFDSVKNTKDTKKTLNPLTLGFIMFVISIVSSYIISIMLFRFGLIKNVIFTALLLSSSAPGLLVSLLKEKNIGKTLLGQIMLIYSLICEFICLILLTFISSTLSTGITFRSFLFILIFIVSYAIYKLVSKYSTMLDNYLVPLSSLHIRVRAAFALILVLVAVSDKTGTEIILGSFLAGIIFKLITKRNVEELHYKLNIIGYGFLIPIFFIMVGINLDIRSIFESPQSLLLIPIFLVIIFIVKFLSSLILIPTYGIRNALSASILLSSQLSLMIVGAQMAYNLQLINLSGYSAFILTTVISCILFPLLFDKVFKHDKTIGILEQDSVYIDNKIIIKQVFLRNSRYFNIALKDLKLPPSCRIFLIVRDEVDILPDGNTILLENDRIVLAGLSETIDEVLKNFSDVN